MFELEGDPATFKAVRVRHVHVQDHARRPEARRILRVAVAALAVGGDWVLLVERVAGDDEPFFHRQGGIAAPRLVPQQLRAVLGEDFGVHRRRLLRRVADAVVRGAAEASRRRVDDKVGCALDLGGRLEAVREDELHLLDRLRVHRALPRADPLAVRLVVRRRAARRRALRRLRLVVGRRERPAGDVLLDVDGGERDDVLALLDHLEGLEPLVLRRLVVEDVAPLVRVLRVAAVLEIRGDGGRRRRRRARAAPSRPTR